MGTRGSVIGFPFSFWMWRITRSNRSLCQLRRAKARCAGVVRTPVVPEARCAGVVRRLVMLKARGAGVVQMPVVRSARFGQRDRVLRVVPDRVPWCRRDTRDARFPIEARCADVLPEARGSDRTPVVPAWFQDGVVGACWRQLRWRVGTPNMALQPTASRARSFGF